MAKSTSTEATPTTPAAVEKTTPSSSEKKGKTSATTPEDQVKFMVECIRHGVNGKIDFEAVASECGIVSKGAAAKRYERLLKAHGIVPAAQISPRDASVASAKRTKAAAPAKNVKAAAEKKRKQIEGENPDNDSEDSEDTSPLAGKKKRVKFEKKERKSSAKGIKLEDQPSHGAEGPKKSNNASLVQTAALALSALGEFPVAVKDEDAVEELPAAVKNEDDELAINDPDFMAAELEGIHAPPAPSVKTEEEEEREVIEV